ncbi:DUF3987 domain-containing protein [Bacteroides sp.]|uniref:DUF3987 domain-containing protein n=1 Tax=Bacteroides sp. TaxID=29523 RepID=UPI0025C67AF9|nr:DUF3987 domain-containing protein [Bacteroides sp.]
MNITLFSNLYSKEAQGVIDAAEWRDAIRDGKYRTIVEKVRSFIEKGMKDEAREWKMKLPAVVFAGDCRMGRFFAKTTERTGWLMFDFDNLTPQQVKAARDLLIVFEWVVMVHVTSSGRGLRVVVNGGMVHIDVYRNAYEKVAEGLKALTGLEPDMQCKDFARTSLASYDPEVYYNPEAAVFDYGTEGNPLSYVPAVGPDTSEDFRVQSARSAMGNSHNVDTQAVIDRFFENNAYTEGSRHETLLYLGKYLRWMGVESWQLDDAVARACSRAVQPGMPEKEVRNAVVWGYEHGTEGVKNSGFFGGKVQNRGMNLIYRDAYAEMADNQELPENEFSENGDFPAEGSDGVNPDEPENQDEDEVIERMCPSLPDDIFGTLPDSLLKLLSTAKDRKERDVLLLSCITVMSGLFPALRTMYGNQKNSAHLYSCFVAYAGAGKGMAVHASLLGKKIHAELEKKYRQAKKEYEAKLLGWEMEVRAAFKERRAPDIDLKPEEPVRDMLFMPPNISKSQMMHTLRDAQEHGNVMVVTEIDSLAEALRTDYGKQTAELRMIFHHETVGQSFKTDKEPVEIESPRLALMMSGTPEQLARFVKTVEDGMYSRFLFYILRSDCKWKSQSPLSEKGKINIRELFEDLAERLKVNFFDSLGKEVTINFTKEQWEKHDKVFGTELAVMSAEGNPNMSAIVFRGGLIAMRVAMVLCGLRILEAGWQVTEFTCQDEDFDSAVRIVQTCMKHSANTTTILIERCVRNKMTGFQRVMPALRKMGVQFRFIEFKNEAKKRGICESTAKRALKKYLESGLVSKGCNVYEKTDILLTGIL